VTRYGDMDYDEDYNNQGLLWWANVQRALAGKKGQRDLRDLLEALKEMPEKRLIHGRIADEKGGMCLVGVLACKRRVERGEDREAVLDDLALRVAPEDAYLAADATAWVGVEVGLRYCLAWHLGYVNDEEFSEYSPEQRYDAIVHWVEGQLQPANVN
jgi:hypothetical protein